ncbi:hypothetical protein GJ496_000113 [Pomphorhynchus laevis]|nr:hypothetical protein GJ496_000113 [Pomphorhynchus laevis]
MEWGTSLMDSHPQDLSPKVYGLLTSIPDNVSVLEVKTFCNEFGCKLVKGCKEKGFEYFCVLINGENQKLQLFKQARPGLGEKRALKRPSNKHLSLYPRNSETSSTVFEYPEVADEDHDLPENRANLTNRNTADAPERLFVSDICQRCRDNADSHCT